MTISNVSDAEIEKEFKNTNFGSVNHRELLEASVLKKAVGYHCGHTITEIMTRMGLITKNGLPSKRGRDFLKDAYHHLMIKSG